MQSHNPFAKRIAWLLLSLIPALCFLLIATQAFTEDFENRDLRKFAEAQTEVVKIRSEYFQALDGVHDEDKAKELRDKYVGQMVEAVEAAGLSVNTYSEIAQALRKNPKLQQKIEGFAD